MTPFAVELADIDRVCASFIMTMRAAADGATDLGISFLGRHSAAVDVVNAIHRRLKTLSKQIGQQAWLNAAFTAADLAPSEIDLDQVGVVIKDQSVAAEQYRLVVDRSAILARQLADRSD